VRRSYPLAAARPCWKGYLKLSLVTCPIALYPAISSEKKVAFRQVSRRTGNRLRHQLVDSVSGEIVESHDKGRGYEVGHNRFVMVEEEELYAARAAQPLAPIGQQTLRRHGRVPRHHGRRMHGTPSRKKTVTSLKSSQGRCLSAKGQRTPAPLKSSTSSRVCSWTPAFSKSLTL
jgi:hypothetical protein